MPVIKNQFRNIYICTKISHFEETSQRDDYIWNWGYYAENNCCLAKLSFYKKH